MPATLRWPDVNAPEFIGTDWYVESSAKPFAGCGQPSACQALKQFEAASSSYARNRRHRSFRLKFFSVVEDQPTVAQRFVSFAKEWERDTSHVSSMSDLVSHPKYQAIISLGWEVVPILLSDLRDNKRFWFPALAAITKIRPFDPKDAGNGRRMTEAWVSWGQRKGLI